MSLHMIFTIIQLLPLRTPSVENADEAATEEGWTYWLYLLSSKGIYSVLVSLILFCCLINAIQSKFSNKDCRLNINIDFSNWVDKFWKHVGGTRLIPCGPLKNYVLSSGLLEAIPPSSRNFRLKMESTGQGGPGFPRLGFHSFDIEDEIMDGQSLFDKVLIAEGELEALKNAVDLARKVGTDLEDSLEEIEKDKDEVEGRSLEEKQMRYSEIEVARADMESLQQQLQMLRKEKDEVILKCQNLQDEAQKAGDALQKRQIIQKRLDEALTVVSVLKEAVAGLEADRDEALISLGSVLPDLALTDESREKLSRLVIKNIRNNQECSLTRSACLEDLHLLGRGDDAPAQNNILSAQQWINYGNQGYGESMVSAWCQDELCDSTVDTLSELNSDKSQNELLDYEHAEEDYLDQDENYDEQMGINTNIQLTKSPAFKQFCQSNFGKS